MENGQSVFCLSSHTPYGRVRLARFARVRLLRHALPISLLILRKKPTVLQSNNHITNPSKLTQVKYKVTGGTDFRFQLQKHLLRFDEVNEME